MTIESQYGTALASLRQQQRKQEEGIRKTVRQQHSEVERRTQEALGEVRRAEQEIRRRAALPSVGAAVAERARKAAKEVEAEITRESGTLVSEVRAAEEKALSELQEAVGKVETELEAWRAEALAAEAEAREAAEIPTPEVPTPAVPTPRAYLGPTAEDILKLAEEKPELFYTTLDTGETIYRAEFENLPPEHQELMMRVGTKEFSRIQLESIMQLPSGEWVDRESFEALPPAMQIAARVHGLDYISMEGTPEEQFEQLRKFGAVPVLAKFTGVTEEGEFEYSVPERPPTKTGKLFGIPLPSWAEGALIKVGQYVGVQPSPGEPWSLESLKHDAIQGSVLIIPGVWLKEVGLMKPWQIGVNVAVDALFLGMVLGPSLKPITRGAARNVARLATEAGVAHETMTATVKAVRTAKIPTPELAMTAQRSISQSMKADSKFAAALADLDKVSIRELVKFEKSSGMSGIKSVIVDITNAQKELSRAWNELDKLKWGTEKYSKQLYMEWGREKYVGQHPFVVAYKTQLRSVEAAKARLNSAMERFFGITRERGTRFEGLEPPFEIVGERLVVEPPKPPEDPLIEALERYLRTEKSLKPTGLQPWELPRGVAVAEREALGAVEIRPIIKEAKPKVRVKPKPRVRVKPEVRVAPAAPIVKAVGIPLEELDRWLAGEPAVIPTEMPAIVPARVVSPEEAVRAATEAATKAATEAAIEAQARAMTEAQIRAAAMTAAETALRTATETAVRTATKTALRTATRTAVKTATRTALKTVVRVGIRPRIPEFPTAVAVGEELYETEGAVAWRQGFVWCILAPPYDKIHYTRTPPAGVKVVKGPGSAYRTLTKWGVVPEELLVDLGVVDISITNKMKYKGRGERTDVGKSHPSVYKGVTAVKGIKL